MVVQEENIGDVRVIRVSGRLVADGSDPLRAAVERALPEPGKIVLDLAGVDFADRQGIGVLAVLRDLSRSYGHVLKIACLQIIPCTVFNMIKVYSLFEIYDNLPAALAAFHR